MAQMSAEMLTLRRNARCVVDALNSSRTVLVTRIANVGPSRARLTISGSSRARSDALALQHLDQRGAVQTEQRRRLLLVPLGSLERLADQLILERLDSVPQIDAGIRQAWRDAFFSAQAA